MFTGLVEELGRVRRADPAGDGSGVRIEIEAAKVLDGSDVGASVAVNGCCVTVVERGEGWWSADVVTETLGRTTLGALRAGDPVNLERPVRLADRLGGHLVQGHVDGVGRIEAREQRRDGSEQITVAAPPEVLRYVVEKGSVAIDGVSLTVAFVGDRRFAVALIPHTLEATTLGRKGAGDAVNLEADVVAKYVERLLGLPGLSARQPKVPERRVEDP